MKYRLLLLLAALIWGFAFAAQVVGMESVGPYTFNGVRFLLGSLALVPIILTMKEEAPPLPKNMPLSAACLMVGLPLFAGATLQQVGLQYTTASKASFLTATYILMVPIIGVFLKETLRITHIAGALLAMAGVYFMSITEDFSIGAGDLMMLLCALGFTIQIHAMTYLTQRFSPFFSKRRHSPASRAPCGPSSIPAFSRQASPTHCRPSGRNICPRPKPL